MEKSEITRLLAPFLAEVPEPLAGSLLPYLGLLQKWNTRTNLSSIRRPEEIVTRHFGESLFAARQLFPAGKSTARATVADVGSGAGFPGIPIKLWAPELQVTLIESQHKKVTFLREVIRTLKLVDIEVRAGRAESLVQTFDVVTLRAVERFEEVVLTAARLVGPGGRLGLLVSDGQVSTAKAMLRGFEWDEPKDLPESECRVLFVGTNGTGT